MRYFDDDIRYKRFDNVVKSWEGTPYRHLGMTRQRGADCGLFMCAILLHCQIITEFKYDYYPPDWHLHTEENYVMQRFVDTIKANVVKGMWFRKYTRGNTNLHRGDILTFSMCENGINNHTALYMENNEVVHSLEGVGVHRVELIDFFEKRMTNIYRLMVT